MRRALITGITGQDGHYLAELLLSQNYEVFGLVRGYDHPRSVALGRELPNVRMVAGDLGDASSISRALQASAPDEIYNLAGVTSIQESRSQPLMTADVNGLGPLRLLEAIRQHRAGARFFQASSSEMFGTADESPQDENTAFRPRNPYGYAKVFAHQTTADYRETHGLFATAGILFNHESPRRGLEFVTRKISYHAAAIKLGRLTSLELDDLDAARDWGFAGDYVRAMHGMLRRDEPRDYVIGTGRTHTVREFVATAFGHVGLRWEDHVVSRPRGSARLGAPLRANASRAIEDLHWTPTVGFEELVGMMVDSDVRALTT